MVHPQQCSPFCRRAPTLKGEVAGSDFVRAMGLVRIAERNLKDTEGQSRVNAEVALKQLFVEILKPNATAMTSKSGTSDQSGGDAKKDIKTEKPTLSSSRFRTILDEVRKLAKTSEQKTLATAEDIAKIGDADAFVAKFS